MISAIGNAQLNRFEDIVKAKLEVLKECNINPHGSCDGILPENGELRRMERFWGQDCKGIELPILVNFLNN